MNKQKPKLLDQLIGVIRLKPYSLKTEKTYIHWVHRFTFFIIGGILKKWELLRFSHF